MVDRLSGDGQPVGVNEIRNKINDIIDGGLGGGGNISVSEYPPTDPAPKEGDLWYDDGSAALYVYYASPISAWIQTNGNGGGGTALKLQTSSTSTLNGGIIIDHNGNKLRIYENGGTFRGAYLDLSQCFAYQGTDVLSGDGGSGGSVNHTTGVQSYYQSLASQDFILPLPITYMGQERTFLVTVAGNWANDTTLTASSGFNREDSSSQILNIRNGSIITSTKSHIPISTSHMNRETGILESMQASDPFVFRPSDGGQTVYYSFLLWNCPACMFKVSRGSSGSMKSVTVTDLGAGAVAFSPMNGLISSNLYDHFYVISYD